MRVPFQYAVVRIVPRIERGEFINGGVVVYCRDRDYLRAAVDLDVDRLLALCADAPVDDVAAALASIVEACVSAGDGPGAREEIGRRFRWITAPRSTVVQAGPVHTGLTLDPAADTDRLLRTLVQR